MESNRYYAVVPHKGNAPDLYFDKDDAVKDWYLNACHWHGWISVTVENE